MSIIQFDPLLFDGDIFDIGFIAVDPPRNWAPPLDLAASTVIGQALRFMHLAPIPRHDPGSEILPALHEAHASASDDLLASADWSFASVLCGLPGVALPPGMASDDLLPGCAALPGDLIVLRQVWPAGTRWRVDGRFLRHDAPGPVSIRHTARVTREDALPATYQTALALHIALQLAGRWAGAGANPEMIETGAVTTLRQAMREDSRQASAASWDADRQGLRTGLDEDWASEVTV